MEELKTERTKKAPTLTRRLEDLSDSLMHDASEEDVREKIITIKHTIEELGGI